LLKQSCINLEANELCLILLLTSKSCIHTFTFVSGVRKRKVKKILYAKYSPNAGD